MNRSRLESLSWQARSLLNEIATHACDLKIDSHNDIDPKNNSRLSEEMIEAYYHWKIGESKLSSILETIKDQLMREVTE